jgi:DNA-directed RNA polymerase specialized sigma24 family protein
MTYSSRARSIVQTASAGAISKPLPVFRARKRSARSTTFEAPNCETHNVAQARAEIRKEAFDKIFAASRTKFVAIALAILRNKEDAEDAVQNAFLSGYVHLGSFEGRSALRTWFTRIVVNAALAIQRKRKASTILPLPENNNSYEVNWADTIPGSQLDPEMIHDERKRLR